MTEAKKSEGGTAEAKPEESQASKAGSAKTYSEAEMQAKLDEQAIAHKAELDEAVKKAKASVRAAEKKKADKAANPPEQLLELPSADGDEKEGAPSAAEVAGCGHSGIVFGDDGDALIRGLPPLTFSENDYRLSGDHAVLTRLIEFPVHGAYAEICSAWLIDEKGKPVAVCRLRSPLRAGGGHRAALPAGTLRF